MDGKNASGRRVSLLNDCADSSTERELPLRLSPISPISPTSPSLCSRTSSYISSPIGSPPIPPLIRSDSSDSTAMESPSPITPDDFAYDPLQDSTTLDHSSFYPQPSQALFQPEKPSNSSYPPPNLVQQLNPYHAPSLQQSTQYPAQYQVQYPAQYPVRPYGHVPNLLQQPLQQQPPVPFSQAVPQQPPSQPLQTRRDSEPHPTAPVSSGRSKKNSYPCPVAALFKCNDYFTTSGHAARHAKKHTGKKDAICPECSKAFTRKDNMEQHRRTHSNGRNASKGTDSVTKKAKQQARRPKPTVLQTSTPTATATVLPQLNGMLVDPSLPDVGYMGPMEVYPPHLEQSSPYYMNQSYQNGDSLGLDALASAADEQRRNRA